jgi:protein disulfide-isomerase A6
MLLSAALLLLAPSVWAGMYGKPVINLDAKTFKQAMSVEHASVRANLSSQKSTSAHTRGSVYSCNCHHY